MISRAQEEAIRQIVREEIALDEMRRIAGESTPAPCDATPGAVPGGLRPPPGTIFLSHTTAGKVRLHPHLWEWFGIDHGVECGGQTGGYQP